MDDILIDTDDIIFDTVDNIFDTGDIISETGDIISVVNRGVVVLLGELRLMVETRVAILAVIRRVACVRVRVIPAEPAGVGH